MPNQNVIVPTNNVEGNITSCGIQTAQVSVDRTSVVSPSQLVTFRSYNVCSGKTVNEYVLQEVTAAGFTYGLFIALLIITVFGVLFSKSDYPL